ncbi:sulfatase [Horticoccus sp. 23ND18S-11]|uniref:sulfatase n=1 Tax=Horticoccus sp. 23ND18S-11 TaxID=3391832 RepID=UPI0039C9CE7C
MKIRPALLWLLALFVPGLAHAADSARPNVLLICVDDLKPLLGCYGDPTSKTPNIDRLASRGTRFDRAYCNQAVCSPSRNSLMTGLRPTSTGIYDLPTNFRVATPDAVTLAQYFQREGWRTESMGKIFHRGHGNFEDTASWSVPHWTSSTGTYITKEALAIKASGMASQTGPAVAKGEPGDKGYRPANANGPAVEIADAPDNAYPDGQVADEAIKRLQAAKQNPGQPLFLAVGFVKPHLPFSAPRKYWDLYDRAALKLAPVQTAPVGAPSYAPTSWGELRAYAGIPADGPLSEATQRELIHGYLAATSYMDAQVGRVLDELDRLALSANTLIVLWGDHGWHLGDHGQWCKHSNYEEATRIPLLVIDPRQGRPGTSSRALVETVDIYPTLAELAGFAAPNVPQQLDGRSFAAVIRNPSSATKDAVFQVYPRSRPGDGAILGRSVRTDRHRLVEWKKPGAAPATAELELYDYVADPLETRNLASEQPEVVGRMRAILATQPEAKPQIAAGPAGETKKKKKKKG